MSYKHEEVIGHWPPRYIIGKTRGQPVETKVQGNGLVDVRLFEIECDWTYSNPTGLYNLSLPDKTVKASSYGYMTTSYKKYKLEQAQAQGVDMPDLITKPMTNHKKSGPVLLKVVFDDNSLKFESKIQVKMTVADNERKNVDLPDCIFSYTLSPRHLRTAWTFQKIDPSKEGFGDITIELNVKGPQTMNRQIPMGIGAAFQHGNDDDGDLYDNEPSTSLDG